MIQEAAALIESTKTLLDLVKAAKDLTNQAAFASAVLDVNRHAMELQTQNFLLLEQINTLKAEKFELAQECVKLNARNNDLDRYELHSFPTGAIAYGLKPGHENGDPVHYLCTTCYSQSKKTTLQPGNRSLHCNVCQSTILTGPIRKLDYPRSGNV